MAGYDWQVSTESGVSVVIPTYNRAELVCEAVSSALQQAWEPLEVVVVDDASSDDTVQRLRALAAGDDRLRVIERERNGGESAARNQGILAATQPYVALLDSDNRFMPDKLARQMPALLSGPDRAVSFSGYVLATEESRSEVILDSWLIESEAVVGALLVGCAVNTSTFIAPRSILVDQGLFRTDLTCCQDHDVWLRLAALGHVFLYEPTPLTFYRAHRDSVSADVARVAKYEELVIGDFLARPDLPPSVAARSAQWRAHWALASAEGYLAAGMSAASLGALARAALAHPAAIRPGWGLIGLRALRAGLTARKQARAIGAVP
jgi:glycosyltransferase involved in cell wall biosynthesis